MKRLNNASVFVICTFLLTGSAALGQATASVPYTVSVFASGVAGSYTKPDSIAVLGNRVFIGYGNGVSTTGSDGKSSTIVEYAMNGDIVNTFSVVGHNDGLRIQPKTKKLWAMQNEDANPNLVIIEPKSGRQTIYTFGPTPHGGGYDDIAFRGDDVFFSASNPASNPNLAPAVVKASFSGTTISVTETVNAGATATDVSTDTPVALNLQDPDSMIVNPLGDLVLDSQADGELVIVHHLGFADQSIYHLALSVGGASTQIDDTVFATASHGVVLVSDRDAGADGSGIVYAISKNIFSPNAAYSATPNSVGALDLDTGVITPVVSGMTSPHGMAFIPR